MVLFDLTNYNNMDFKKGIALHYFRKRNKPYFQVGYVTKIKSVSNCKYLARSEDNHDFSFLYVKDSILVA